MCSVPGCRGISGIGRSDRSHAASDSALGYRPYRRAARGLDERQRNDGLGKCVRFLGAVESAGSVAPIGHMQHQIRRWDTDHTGELHAAWMNGSGMMVWENVFGSWVPWNQRDRSLLRAILPIQRRFSPLFSGEEWTPLVPVEQPGVFASLWEGDNLRLWTLVNRTEQTVEGPLLRVAARPGDGYFDLIAGSEASTKSAGAAVLLSGLIPPRGVGCFLSGKHSHWGKDFNQFLKRQTRVNARSVSDTARPQVQTKLLGVKPAKLWPDVPDGMVEIPPATLELSIDMRVRECGFYESMPQADSGLQDSYGFHVRNFRRRVELKRFAMA